MTPSEELVIEFTRALARRDYEAAFDMTSSGFESANSIENLRNGFEMIVPLDWGNIDPIEIGTTLDDWPEKRANDINWVYVVIGGDVYSEAVIVVVSEESEILRIRKVEWGRP